MTANAIISAVNHRRIGRAGAWLEGRAPAEEVLIVAQPSMRPRSSRAASPRRKVPHSDGIG
jgi:hypothetical protein